MSLNVLPMEQPIGAIVEGWRPETALSEAERETILQALRDHLVLVFRGNPQPADEELIGFAATFGDLVKGSEWFQDIGPRPEILSVNNLYDDDGVAQGTGGSDKLGWHADYSYVPRVGKESFLNAVEIPENPPRTCFSNQYRALATLPESTVKQLRSLTGFHSITNYVKGESEAARTSADKTDATRSDQGRSDFIAKRQRNRELGLDMPDIPQAEHPLIISHPDSGREILYISPQILRYVTGMPADESEELLKELRRHSVAEENVYCHDWQVGDLVMFDTLGSLHRRDSWDPSQRRVMRQLSTMV